MAREVRVSPDGDAIAIRSNWDEDAWNAWGYMHAVHGGGWVNSKEVADWDVVVVGSTDEENAATGPEGVG